SHLSVQLKRTTFAFKKRRLACSMPCLPHGRKSPAIKRSRVFARNGKTLVASNPSQSRADLWDGCEIISERDWAGLHFSSDSSLAAVSPTTWDWARQFKYW